MSSAPAIARLFAAAVALSPEARASFVDGACADDPASGEQLRQLLAAHARFEGWDLQPGDEVGDYIVVGTLGRGGMGVVYRAGHRTLRRMAALKVVRSDQTRAPVLARFFVEQQVLASLTHPHIAVLYDVGVSADGRAFFAMELVEGVGIDDYCKPDTVSLERRLELFVTVCRAVHFAHQQGVIHRDIKANNVLVTAAGEPKLLDFGLATMAMGDGSDARTTVTAERWMTPDYASPEQIRGERATTASDVYALGALLYRLLTGVTPFEERSGDALPRAILHDEPIRPSVRAIRPLADRSANPGLARRMKGDIDHIVLKALAKDPAHRYSSADQLAEDVRHHLTGLPIRARGQTLGYRARLFARRHKAGVVSGAAALLLAIFAIAAIVWQARVAERERARAERRFHDVRTLANSFMFEIHDAIDNLAGSTKARELLVSRALQYLDSLSREATDDSGLQVELATSYRRIGDVQGYPYDANLGDLSGALASYRKGVGILEDVRRAGNHDPEVYRSHAATLQRIGDVLMANGRSTEALEHQQQSLEVLVGIADAPQAPRPLRRTWAVAHLKIGEALENLRRPVEALESYQRSATVFAALYAEDPKAPEALRDIGVGHSKVGDVLRALGRPLDALESYRVGLGIRERAMAANPDDAELRRDVSVSQDRIAGALADAGRIESAIEAQQQALGIDAALAAADPANSDAQRDVASDRATLGYLLSEQGKWAPAREHLDAALKSRRALLERSRDDAELRGEVGDSYLRLARVLAKQGLHVSAADHCRNGRGLAEELRTLDDANGSFHELVALARVICAEVSDAAGRSVSDLDADYEAARLILLDLQARMPLSPGGRRLLDHIQRRDGARVVRSRGVT
jgi:eukaryotic-like serine/threonine-protein kinase